MRAKNRKWLIIILCAVILAAVIVTVILLERRNGEGTGDAVFTRTGDEAGVTIEWGLSQESFSDNSAVTAWLEKCNRPDRDDQDAYALRYTDVAPDGSMTCTWLVLRRGADAPAGQPSVTVSETRGGDVTLTLTYADGGEVMKDSLCRITGSFGSEPALEVEGTLGIIVSVTNQPF